MAPRRDALERSEGAVTALGVVAPPPIHIESPAFEGSLGTLFRLVRDHRVDLLGVPLFPICEAYFAYLLQAETDNLDEAAAALAALAYLLERKAWMLLPGPDPEPEAEEPMELPEATTYEYRAAIEALAQWHEDRASLFFRSPDAGPDPYELPYTLGDVGVADLARALERVLSKAEPEPMKPLSRPRRSLAEQMRRVLLAVSDRWQNLGTLLPPPYTRWDAVYWFLALLELIRLGQVAARLTETGDVEFARAP
jgi:segregation and condensation protein A